MEIKIIVASHKPYEMPTDSAYLPVLVGASLADKKRLEETSKWAKDNEGENISDKNPTFCELTGLYWAWKNLSCDIIGLAHYRRHFGKRAKGGDSPLDGALTGEQAESLLEKAQVLVPRKRKYYIETLQSHYCHSHDGMHLEVLRYTMEQLCPEYIPHFDKVMSERGGYMFNMFIMRRELTDEYCSFLFPLLFAVEEKIDTSEMSAFDARLFGRLSELLLNVWLSKQVKDKGITIREVPYFHVEKINWFKKGGAFLAAKFGRKKYEGSF